MVMVAVIVSAFLLRFRSSLKFWLISCYVDMLNVWFWILCGICIHPGSTSSMGWLVLL